ncbi:protein FAM234A [Salminus brasiliensis]|uniref:protein FAM234A n=1 Tax=Salminus brasiliensis TaxID=930266 RepID=UPI003B82F461
MSDPAERPAEAEPLKGEQVDGVCKERRVCCGRMGLSKLSGWRTAAFLLSLFLCLTVVFAFSFILPCPVRPQYLHSWNRTLPNAATYDFLAMEDANKDKVQDVFFMYKSAEGSMNHTCTGEGLRPPCLFLLAVDGTDGETLWERPLAAEFDWVQCGVGGVEVKGKTCLVAHADNFTAIDSHTGAILWQRPRSPVIKGNLPVIILPDLNSDGIGDFAVLSYNRPPMSHTPIPTELVFFSGKSGAVIGSKVDVDSRETRAHLQFTTARGAQYLLLHTDMGLYAVGLWRLSEKAGLKSDLKKENSWEKIATHTGLIPLYKSVSLKKVLLVKGSGDSPSLLLYTPTSVQLLNTHTLSISWTTNTSMLLSIASFGHYNEDGVPDVVLEEDQGNATKRVVILDGKTGSVLWKASLLFWSQSPRPASVLTLNSYSVFMLWGERHRNETSSAAEEHSTYLLHPRHPQVLLERKNPTQHIMSFKAVLLERGRHACYLVLSGANGALVDDAGIGGAEPVLLTKRKIKDDVQESSVLGVGGAEGVAVSRDKEDTVKQAFNRLRFSDEVK